MCKTKTAVATLKASKQKTCKTMTKEEFFHFGDCVGDDLDTILQGQKVTHELLAVLSEKHKRWEKFIQFCNTRVGVVLIIAGLGVICSFIGLEKYQAVASPIDVTAIISGIK